MFERLKKVREKLGKSQKEMAATVGISYPAWQRYELGKNIPGATVIEELVKIGFNANWLLTGEGPMETDVKKQFYVMLDGLFGKRHVRLLNRIRHLLNEYTKNDPSFTDDMALNVSTTAFGVLFRKDDSWLTDENINLVMKSLIDLHKTFDTFKGMNISNQEIKEIIDLILDPEKWEVEMENHVLDVFSDGREGSKVEK